MSIKPSFCNISHLQKSKLFCLKSFLPGSQQFVINGVFRVKLIVSGRKRGKCEQECYVSFPVFVDFQKLLHKIDMYP